MTTIHILSFTRFTVNKYLKYIGNILPRERLTDIISPEKKDSKERASHWDMMAMRPSRNLVLSSVLIWIMFESQ